MECEALKKELTSISTHDNLLFSIQRPIDIYIDMSCLEGIKQAGFVVFSCICLGARIANQKIMLSQNLILSVNEMALS